MTNNDTPDRADLTQPKQDPVGDLGEVIKWLDDAFADIADSRERMGKSNDVLDRCERVLNTIRALTAKKDPDAELLEAAQEVIDRWHTPLWKDVPATAGYIHALRDAIAAANQADEVKGIDGLEEAIQWANGFDFLTGEQMAHFLKLHQAAREHLKRQKGR